MLQQSLKHLSYTHNVQQPHVTSEIQSTCNFSSFPGGTVLFRFTQISEGIEPDKSL